MPLVRLAALAAATLVSLPAPSPAQPAPAAVASIDARAGADLDRLRTLAWRGAADSQLDLAMRLGDTHRRGGAPESALVEAAYWAGRSWSAPRPVEPSAIAAFVAAHCGAATISRHWICSEGE